MEDEDRLLVALAWMVEQYLGSGGELDSQSMAAGEGALEVLADRGLVELSGNGRFGVWTSAGRRLLDD